MKTIYHQKHIDNGLLANETDQENHHSTLQQYIENFYPVLLKVVKVMEELFDCDHDGMIENSGFPDQTYDVWTAKGVHAYCGGLWITACEAIKELATFMKDETTVIYYTALVLKAKEVYLNQLWNGLYLNYDSSNSSYHDSIMADMLAGQWFARSCQLTPPISSGHAFSCLKIIYEYNVLFFGKGEFLGAVNGMKPDNQHLSSFSPFLSSASSAGTSHNNNPSSNNSGVLSMAVSSFQYASFASSSIDHNNGERDGHHPTTVLRSSSHEGRSGSVGLGDSHRHHTMDASIDHSCLQSREVWAGTTYGLAATMLQEAFFSSPYYNPNNPNGESNKEQDQGEGGDNTVMTGAIGSNVLTDLQRKELIEMAYHTAKGIHDAGWQKFGYWFATPEAWEVTGHYRSLGYMRPLCIWSIQYAREQFQFQLKRNTKK
jgi:uncharacterized protein (DUF608 family)